MRPSFQKPGLKKLFSNKFLTYMVTGSNGKGDVVEVEVKVNGKDITYSYTNIKHRG